VQTHRFGEHASNIETRQYCAFPGQLSNMLCTAAQLPRDVGNVPRERKRCGPPLPGLTLFHHVTRLFHDSASVAHLVPSEDEK
jgi:hypothetical protein